MTQFLRDQASDSEEVVTPLMLDGTYLSRNFATLGPLTWQPPCDFFFSLGGCLVVNGSKGEKQNFFDIKFLTSSMRSLHSLHPLDHGGKEKNNRRVIKSKEERRWRDLNSWKLCPACQASSHRLNKRILRQLTRLQLAGRRPKKRKASCYILWAEPFVIKPV